MKLHIEETGNRQRPLLVFLHGGGVSGWIWEQQIKAFQEDYHCVIPHLPGHGKSKESIFSMTACAKQLGHFIQAKAEDKPVFLIGFSLGAQLTIEIASQYPELADGLVLQSPLVLPMPMMRKWLRPMLRLAYPFIRNRTFAKWQAKELYIQPRDFERYFRESQRITYETLLSVMDENMAYSPPANFRHAKLEYSSSPDNVSER